MNQVNSNSNERLMKSKFSFLLFSLVVFLYCFYYDIVSSPYLINQQENSDTDPEIKKVIY